MIIAVTSMGADLADDVSSRFGRAPYFLLLDSESADLLEAIENPNVSAGGGAGVQSSQILADKGVQAVLTGNCGPKAFQVFAAAGIDICTGASGSVLDALRDYKAGELQSAAAANVGSHHGA